MAFLFQVIVLSRISIMPLLAFFTGVGFFTPGFFLVMNQYIFKQFHIIRLVSIRRRLQAKKFFVSLFSFMHAHKTK